MSHSQFHSMLLLILRHAWLNLWDKHMTTGRINQVTIIKRNPFYANQKSKELLWSSVMGSTDPCATGETRRGTRTKVICNGCGMYWLMYLFRCRQNETVVKSLSAQALARYRGPRVVNRWKGQGTASRRNWLSPEQSWTAMGIYITKLSPHSVMGLQTTEQNICTSGFYQPKHQTIWSVLADVLKPPLVEQKLQRHPQHNQSHRFPICRVFQSFFWDPSKQESELTRASFYHDPEDLGSNPCHGFC